MINNDLFEKALNNDVDALLELGKIYYDGKSGEEDMDKAFVFYQKAFELEPENLKAINRLANCYYYGIGTKKNIERALELYRNAANSGNRNAQYNLASALEEMCDPECICWYEKLCENGDSDCAVKLANIYKEDKLVRQDIEKYFEWLNRASELGNKNATTELGRNYLEGELCEYNSEKGIKFLNEAVEKGSSEAAKLLSIAYIVNNKDLDLAEKWAMKASFAGEHIVLNLLAEDYCYGKNGIASNETKAFELYLFDALCGSVDSCFDVANCYYNGIGTKLDKQQAIVWYEKACLNGSFHSFSALMVAYKECEIDEWESKFFNIATKAADEGYCAGMTYLYNCYIDGIGTEKNPEKALSYLRRAADGEYFAACIELGRCYCFGENGVEQNSAKAVSLWNIASDNGNAQAKHNLGMLYSVGADGVEKNTELAVKFLTEASDLGYVESHKKLAVAYYENGFAETNYEKARKYFLRSYECGDIDSAVILGIIYTEGKGVEPDSQKAAEYFTFAAENGNAKSYVMLGSIYFDPKKRSSTWDKGIECYKKAIELNVENAEEVFKAACSLALLEENSEYGLNKLISILEQFGEHDGILLAGKGKFELNKYAESIPCFEKALAKGKKEAAYYLGKIYVEGLGGIPKNIKYGMDLMFEAAVAGYDLAQCYIGLSYFTGEIMKTNIPEGLAWLESAATNGNETAKRALENFCKGN